MSTASIRKPLIIASDKSAKVIADILDSSKKKVTSKDSLLSVKEIKDKPVLSLLKGMK